MNIAIAVDFIIERDETTYLLDVVVNLFPKAPIYTISHVEGVTLGEIEHHPIRSSFLTHKIKTKKDIGKYAYLIPKAIEQLRVLESDKIDKFIILSEGFMHQFNPKEIPSVSLIYDRWNNYSSLFQKMFKNYLNFFQVKNINNKNVFFISESLKNLYHCRQDKFLAPCFKIDDFHIEKNQHFDELKYLILVSDKTPLRVLKMVENVLASLNLQYDVEGLKKKSCHGDLNLFIQNSRAVIDLENYYLPFSTLACFTLGKACITLKHIATISLFKGAPYRELKTSKDEFKTQILEMEKEYRNFDKEKSKMFSYKFHETKFKTGLIKILT